MRDLATFFVNPITIGRIALERKEAFGRDSIAKITVQNSGGELTVVLEATKKVQDNLFGSVNTLGSNRAIREARTKTVNGVITAFTARNSRLNNFFIGNETDKEDVYAEFFPQGVQPYTAGVTKENVEQRIESLLKAINNNLDVAGGKNVQDEYQAFWDDYKKARDAQQTKSGEIKDGMEEVSDAEIAWDDQMFSNLLTFAQLNRNKPENLALYMDQSLLEKDKQHNTTLTGKVTGMITDAAGHPQKNVQVTIADGKMDNAHTDANGNYLTHPLPIGTWQIVYSKGKLQVTKEVLIEEGKTLQLDVVLGK